MDEWICDVLKMKNRPEDVHVVLGVGHVLCLGRMDDWDLVVDGRRMDGEGRLGRRVLSVDAGEVDGFRLRPWGPVFLALNLLYRL